MTNVNCRGIFSLLVLTLFGAMPEGVVAQKAVHLRLNEVLVINKTNVVDNYCNRSPWIEIYNNSAATVDIKGCYLTNNPNNLKLYSIPKGDFLTSIKPHRYILFWADSAASRGTFHLNFTLYPGLPNFLALVDVDGRTIIDSLTIDPKYILPDRSFGRKLDGAGGIGNKNGAWGLLNRVTPGAGNTISNTNEKLDRLEQRDNFGSIMTVTSMSVVFVALILLTLIFSLIGKQAVNLSRKRVAKEQGIHPQKVDNKPVVSGEVSAAISIALYMQLEPTHDLEQTILTIRRVERKYSPWSSKIYNMRHVPERKITQ